MLPRIRAFLIHLAASAVLASMALGLVFGLWYPHSLAKAVGVTNIFLLVLGVDVFIGPVLTLVVYRVGKKSLRFDLATIIILQLAAFSYGLWTVAEGRPAWLVFNSGRFDLVQAHKVDERNLDQVEERYRHPSWFGPTWVAAHSLTFAQGQEALLFESVFGGVDIPQRPQLYYPLSDAADDMRKHARPLIDLDRFNPPGTAVAVQAEWPEADAFLPMMAKVQPMTVLIHRESAKIIAIVDLSPWE